MKVKSKKDSEYPFQPLEFSFQRTSPSGLYKVGRHHYSPYFHGLFPIFNTCSSSFRPTLLVLWPFLVAGSAIRSALWHKGEASVGQACHCAGCLGEQGNCSLAPLRGAALETAPWGTWHLLIIIQAEENCGFNKTETKNQQREKDNAKWKRWESKVFLLPEDGGA